MRTEEDRLIKASPLIALAAVLALVPAAAAASGVFGPPEPVDPGHWLDEYDAPGPVLAADGAGRALLLAVDDQDRAIVYERCGSGWSAATPISPPTDDIRPQGIAVARNGSAMAVARATTGATTAFYSAVREPGGAWGQPQPITGDGPGSLQFALADGGAAVAAWNDGGIWAATRPAGGAWATPQKVANGTHAVHLAVAANGDAVLVTYETGHMLAYFRPAGGSWGGAEDVMGLATPQTVVPQDVEFTGGGVPVTMWSYHTSIGDYMLAATRSAGGAWASPAQPLIHEEQIGAPRLLRHPSGLVALWEQSPNGTQIRLGAARYSAAWETPKVYDDPNRYVEFDGAVDDAGEILVAAQLDHGANLEDIYGATVPSLAAPWPALTRLSPASDGVTGLYRAPLAAAGGNAFFLGWSNHAIGPRSAQVAATNAAPACAGAAPTPTPTATAAATPPPQPQPQPQPVPQAKPTAAPPKASDFVTVATAKHCRGSVTVKVKGAVKRVIVRLNGRRRATITGRRLTLTHLPKRAYTLSFEIQLKNGRTVKGKQRVPACR